MLVINVPELEGYDNSTKTFVKSEGYTLQLEHSLVSLSKWESEFERPFLTDGPKTSEETLAYVRCMCLNIEPTDEMLRRLSDDNLRQISNHINRKMTATWFSENQPRGRSREVVTSELIYFWMFNYQIAIECENWHLNRLLTTIRVANEKNAPKKKQPRTKPSDLAAQRRELNAQRMAQSQASG